MRSPFKKRWWVQRFNRLTGCTIWEESVDRKFWTRKRADETAERLNSAMAKISRTDRFRVVRVISVQGREWKPRA